MGDAQLVLSARQEIFPKDKAIADPKTAMALYSLNNVVVYNGPPSKSEPSFATDLFKNKNGGKTYVLIEKDSDSDLINLAKEGMVELISLEKNNSYNFYLVGFHP